MLSPNSPNSHDSLPANSKGGKLKADDRNCSSKQSGYKLPEILDKIRQRLNLIGFVTSMLLLTLTYYFKGMNDQPILLWAVFSAVVIVLLFGFLQTLLPTSPSGVNIGVIGLRTLQSVSILMAGILMRSNSSEALLILPAIGVFSGENSLLLEFARGLISIGQICRANAPAETYAIVAISYLDGIFYLITCAVLWQINLTKSQESPPTRPVTQQKSEPTQNPQTMMVSDFSARDIKMDARDVELSEVFMEVKHEQEVSSYGDLSEKLSPNPTAKQPRETHRLNNPMFKERKTTQIQLFESPLKANSRKSTYNKRNQKLVINFNLAANAEGLQYARSHDPKKDGTALDIPIPNRYTANRGASQNEFRFEYDSD